MTSASVPIPDISHIPCGDFLAFQEILKRMRTVDDKIIYEMNMTIPTSSFAKGVDFTVQCNQLHHRLLRSYDDRDGAIKKCLSVMQQRVDDLRRQRELQPDDFNLMKGLRSSQNTLRMLQSELIVEEIVRDRSVKVLHERCRGALDG